MTAPELTLNVTEFKTKSLKLLDQLSRGEIGKITVTKRGRPLAIVEAVPGAGLGLEGVYGTMRGRSRALSDIDLTKPIYEGPLPADPLLGSEDAAA